MTEKVSREIKKRAQQFVKKNPVYVGHLHVIETAMVIGALAALEQEILPENENVIRVTFGNN